MSSLPKRKNSNVNPLDYEANAFLIKRKIDHRIRNLNFPPSSTAYLLNLGECVSVSITTLT